jgi:hypothetical protein
MFTPRHFFSKFHGSKDTLLAQAQSPF